MKMTYRDKKAKKLKHAILADKRRKIIIKFLSAQFNPAQISEFLKKPWEELGNRTPNDMLYKKKNFKKLMEFADQYVQALAQPDKFNKK